MEARDRTKGRNAAWPLLRDLINERTGIYYDQNSLDLMPPPREHVCFRKHDFSETVLRLVQRRAPDENCLPKLLAQPRANGFVHAVGVDSRH